MKIDHEQIRGGYEATLQGFRNKRRSAEGDRMEAAIRKVLVALEHLSHEAHKTGTSMSLFEWTVGDDEETI